MVSIRAVGVCRGILCGRQLQHSPKHTGMAGAGVEGPLQWGLVAERAPNPPPCHHSPHCWLYDHTAGGPGVSTQLGQG